MICSSSLWAQCNLEGPPVSLIASLLSCRNWITFAPPEPFKPGGPDLIDEDLKNALKVLFQEGWRGLVTYSLDGKLSQVLRLAKQTGFQKVIAGIFWCDEDQFKRERTAAMTELSWIDGFVVGNEGLTVACFDGGPVPRYTPRPNLDQSARDRLKWEIIQLRSDTQRFVTTTEVFGAYDPDLLSVGDWVFPNIHPWNNNVRSVAEAVKWTEERVQELQSKAPRVIIVKETWWPTAGNSAASEDNQVAYFRGLSGGPVKFIFGEAYDQFWKTGEGPWDPSGDSIPPKKMRRKLLVSFAVFMKVLTYPSSVPMMR